MGGKKALENIGFEFCKSILEEGATYSSIILSKGNSVLYSYSTDDSWNRLYHETGFSKSCHLITATKTLSEKNENFTLFWDSVKPNNEISHYLNVKREENNICHGVSFCNINNNGILEILTIAGRNCDLNFSSQVIENKDKIKKNLLHLQNKYLWIKKASY